MSLDAENIQMPLFDDDGLSDGPFFGEMHGMYHSENDPIIWDIAAMEFSEDYDPLPIPNWDDYMLKEDDLEELKRVNESLLNMTFISSLPSDQEEEMEIDVEN